MLKRSWKAWSFIGWAPLAALVASVALAGPAQASTTAPSGLSFDGDFSTLTPWTTGGGGAQCSNYGTPSQSPRLRGSFNFATNVDGMAHAGEFTLPADTSPSTYPLEACDLLPQAQPIGLGTDGYYGLMIYVPAGWTIPNTAFDGVEIEEYHFQNIYGAPISFQLHADHVTLAVQTGGCSNYTTAAPGCAYHSNADNPNGNPGNLPAYYAIPTGAFQEGAWNDIVMHVHWANDTSGQIQTWYKVDGTSTWNQSTNITGIPTVQWDNAVGCCASSYEDETEAYTGALSSPLSLWLGNDVTGSTFNAVAGAMTVASPPTSTPPVTTPPATTPPVTTPPVTTTPKPKPVATIATQPRPKVHKAGKKSHKRRTTKGKHKATKGKHKATKGKHKATKGKHKATKGKHKATKGKHKANRV
jgi:hypothetical protein